MFGKYLVPIVLLVGVILFSSVVAPILNGMENFETSQEMPNGKTRLICPGCKGDGTCTCYKINDNDEYDLTKGMDYEMRKGSLVGGLFDEKPEVKEGMANEYDKSSGIACFKCHKDAKLCECLKYKDDTNVMIDKPYLATMPHSDTNPTNPTTTTGTTKSVITSTPGTVDPALQGKHPMPYADLVDIVKKNEEVEDKQTKHIEDIRKVLANTITSLEKDDVLPSGSHCSCANAPVIDPLTGEADLTNGCKPPGWLRMMNSRNARDEECTN